MNGIFEEKLYFLSDSVIAVADPRFPVGGGVDLVGGAWTPEAVTFRKFCMSKQKNRGPLGTPRSANALNPLQQEEWFDKIMFVYM